MCFGPGNTAMKGFEPFAIWLLLWALSSYYLFPKVKSKIVSIGGGFLIGAAGVVVTLLFIQAYVAAKTTAIAQQAGFSNFEEYKRASASGFQTKSGYDAHLELEGQRHKAAVRREAEEKQRQQALESELRKQQIEANAAVRKAKMDAEAEQCKKNLECWGKRNLAVANALCDDAVERLAKYEFEWIDEGWLSFKFWRYRWSRKTDFSLILATG